MTDIDFSELIAKNIDLMKEQLQKLLSASKYGVIEVKGNFKQHNVKGVYLISCNGKTVYVGKTRSGTIGTRIRDHITITESSDLNQMIKRHSDFPQELIEYKVQYIEVSNDRRRGLIEDFVVSILNPPFNRVEN